MEQDKLMQDIKDILFYCPLYTLRSADTEKLRKEKLRRYKQSVKLRKEKLRRYKQSVRRSGYSRVQYESTSTSVLSWNLANSPSHMQVY